MINVQFTFTSLPEMRAFLAQLEAPQTAARLDVSQPDDAPAPVAKSKAKLRSVPAELPPATPPVAEKAVDADAVADALPALRSQLSTLTVKLAGVSRQHAVDALESFGVKRAAEIQDGDVRAAINTMQAVLADLEKSK